ncbi:MAG: EAL domain-containing protein [Bradyrhizobium sp.]|jgi:sensor c-di-GMP phosphodiesterase-like protein
MKLRWPSVTQLAIVAASLVAFATGGHFAAKAVIEGQQSRQLEELVDVALRRSEVAVDFGAATLDELTKRGPLNCDPASLQAVRLQVYQRSAVKDIRLVNRDGSVICSAYSETLEFDNGWVDRPEMLPSNDNHLLLFRVDQFSGIALGVLRDLDGRDSLVAILGINSYLFDIMPVELRAHSEVILELNNGSDIGRFSLKHPTEFSQLVSFNNVSSRYPLHATIRVERNALQRWNGQAYWPILLIALGLGAVFGLLLTRTTARLEGPISDIDRGLARREFKPFYQPTFDLRTGAILGCEVLARWIREDGTVIAPMSFIPLAESSGRIEPMTWQILETALEELYPRLREDKQFKLSINVVPRHMLSDGFIETLRRVVLDAKVSARQIVLEITERNELPELDRAAAVVKDLRELGFRVAMDDVGVGHSGLSQMKGLGANTIKIDKFFVDTITESGSAATIIETLARLARDLHMTVIAEGIETVEQVQALISCGVEEGQGYIISPPLPFGKFDELLEIRRSRAFAEAVVRQAALVG